MESFPQEKCIYLTVTRLKKNRVDCRVQTFHAMSAQSKKVITGTLDNVYTVSGNVQTCTNTLPVRNSGFEGQQKYNFHFLNQPLEVPTNS